MKAINLYVAGLLSLLLVVSCDDDDEATAPIAGVWAGNKAEYRLNPNGIIPPFTITEDDLRLRLEFKNDGTLLLADEGNQTATGTYGLSGRDLTINISYQFEFIDMDGTYHVEELTTPRLRVSIEKEGTYVHPDTGEQFNGTVKATLYFDRQE